MAPPCFDNDVDEKTLFDFVVVEGNGVKGMVDSGLTKVPRGYIQPPNERIKLQSHDDGLVVMNQQLQQQKLPVIDICELEKEEGNGKRMMVDALVNAAETLGFFQVINHGVPLELLEKLKQAAHNFFNQTPQSKAVYLKGLSPSPLVKYGTSFVPEKEKALEWKDYLSMIYTNDEDARKFWPETCKEVALEYLKTSNKMVRKILDVLMGELGVKVDESMADAIMGGKLVNMNFYPTCPNPDLTVGVGRHSDMGTLTILLQDGIGGLYVRTPKEQHEEDDQEQQVWIEIPPIAGALVINVGDSLQILSNGRYKSAEHRVRTTSSESRVSVPIFVMPKATTKIGPLAQVVDKDGRGAPPRYKELLFQDYMNNFFGKAHQGKKSLDFAKITTATTDSPLSPSPSPA